MPESQWLTWLYETRAIYRWTENTIQSEVRFGDKKIAKILSILVQNHNVDSTPELIAKLHRDGFGDKKGVISMIADGFLLDSRGDIIYLTKENFHLEVCKHVIKPYPRYSPKGYFTKFLFPGLNLTQIWNIYNSRNSLLS